MARVANNAYFLEADRARTESAAAVDLACVTRRSCVLHWFKVDTKIDEVVGIAWRPGAEVMAANVTCHWGAEF